MDIAFSSFREMGEKVTALAQVMQRWRATAVTSRDSVSGGGERGATDDGRRMFGWWLPIRERVTTITPHRVDLLNWTKVLLCGGLACIASSA
jgi:hypothetical protein